MVKRSLTHAVRPLAGLRASLVEPVTARRFSTTPAYGVSAVFSETDNAKLNELLNTIQEKIILPAYLPPKQRERVFDPKMRNHLQQNPVVIELDGLEHKFSTIDRFSEVPNSKTILNSALQNMKTTQDWQNLGTLLAGYRKAGIRLHKRTYARIIRNAGQNGQAYTIIDCAKQSQKTGIVLTEKEYVVQLMARINEKITANPGNAKEAAQASRWAEIVLDLLERPEHIKKDVKPIDRPFMSPLVRGQALFAQASAALTKQQAGEPIDAELTALSESVEFLSGIWARLGSKSLSEVQEFVELNPHASTGRVLSKRDYDPSLSGFNYVQAIAQNIKGFSLARELVSDAAKGLQAADKALDQHLEEFAKAGPAIKEAWVKEYETVTGRTAKWASAGRA